MTVSRFDLRPGEMERLAFWLRHAPDGAWLIALYDAPSIPPSLSESLCDMACLAVPLTQGAAGSLSRLPDGERGVLSTWGLVESGGVAREALESLRNARQHPLHVLLLWLTLEERDMVLETAPTLWSRSSGYFDLREGWQDTPDPRPLAPIRYPDWADWEEQVEFAEQALAEQRQSGDPLGELGLELTARLSRLYFAASQHGRAKHIVQDLLEIAEARGSRRGIALVSNDVGLYHYVEGDFQDAIRHYRRALSLYREAGALSGEAAVLTNLGAAQRDGGDRSKARPLFDEALSRARSTGDRWVEATILNQLGGFYHQTGDERQALDYFNHALELRREVADRPGEAITLDNLRRVYIRLEEFEKAQEITRQALTIERELGGWHRVAFILNHLGRLASRQGDEGEALRHYRLALRLWQNRGDQHDQAIALNNIGVAYHNIARRYHRERTLDSLRFKMTVKPASDASSRQVEIESPPEDQKKVTATAEAAQQALDAYGQALVIRRELGEEASAARILMSMAEVDDLVENYASAQTRYAQALALWEALEDRFMEAKTWARMGGISAKQEDREQALDACDRAFSLLEAVDGPADVSEVLNALGLIYEEQSAPERAVACYDWAFRMGLEGDAVDTLLLYKIREISPTWALDLATEGVEHQRAKGERSGGAELLAAMADLHRSAEHYAEALDHYHQALDLSRELGDRQFEASVLGRLANTHDRMARREEALEGYAQAAAIWRELGNLLGEGYILNLMMMALQFSQPPEYERLIPVLERKIEVEAAMGEETASWEQMRDLCRQRVAGDAPEEEVSTNLL